MRDIAGVERSLVAPWPGRGAFSPPTRPRQPGALTSRGSPRSAELAPTASVTPGGSFAIAGQAPQPARRDRRAPRCVRGVRRRSRVTSASGRPAAARALGARTRRRPFTLDARRARPAWPAAPTPSAASRPRRQTATARLTRRPAARRRRRESSAGRRLDAPDAAAARIRHARAPRSARRSALPGGRATAATRSSTTTSTSTGPTAGDNFPGRDRDHDHRRGDPGPLGVQPRPRGPDRQRRSTVNGAAATFTRVAPVACSSATPPDPARRRSW